MTAIAYPYLVHLRATKKNEKSEDHVIPVTAYNLMEAMQQAMLEVEVEVEANHGLLGKGFLLSPIKAGPDVEKLRSDVEKSLADLRKAILK